MKRCPSTEDERLREPMNSFIRTERRRLMKRIRALVTPHFWESGFRVGPLGSSRPMKLVAFKDDIDIPNAMGDVKSILGFCENGVIDNAYGGGCTTAPLAAFPLEDLYQLEKLAERAGKLKRSSK
jgi:hypothetical protein